MSIPSGLPSGMQFNTELAAALSASKRNARSLERLFITHDSPQLTSRLRFEQLLEILRATVDRRLTVLRVFDAPAQPNSLHYFLADAMLSGARVLTTNFDSLIEAAYCSLPAARRRKLDVACFESRHRNFPQCSFQEHETTQRSTVLYKLHGTIRLLTSKREPEHQDIIMQSLGATLDAIGERTTELRLERHKLHALRHATRRRTLFVIGYSGLDDFDVIPSLIATIPIMQHLVWISHAERDPSTIPQTESSLPHRVLQAAEDARVPVTVIKGRTNEALEAFFPEHWPVTRPGAPTRVRRESLISLNAGEKDVVIAAIADALDFNKEARQHYRDAAAYFVQHKRPDLATFAIRRQATITFHLGRTAEALRLIDRTLHFARKFGLEREISRGLTEKATFLARSGNTREALSAAKEARSECHDSPAALIAALRREAQLNRTLGQIPAAMKLLCAALSLARRRRDRAEAAGCLMELSQVHRITGNDTRALRAIYQAQTLYRLLNRAGGLAAAHTTEGNIHLKHGKVQSAIAAYRKAIEGHRHTGKEQGVATAIANIGVAYQKRGHYGRALRQFHTALGMNDRIGNQEGIARDSENIAIIHLLRGAFSEADTWFNKALTINSAIGKREGVAMSLNNMATARRLKGDLSAARPLLRSALALNKKLQRPSGIASVLHNRAELEFASGRIATAHRSASAALMTARQCGSAEVVADAAELLAKIYSARGDQPQARSHLQLALRFATKAGNTTKQQELRQRLLRNKD